MHRDPDGRAHLAVTGDGARTWQRAAATGLRRDAGTGLGVVLSPRYRDDRRLFVTVGTGTYVSTDRGATFTLLDPLAADGRPGNPVAHLATPLLPSPSATDPSTVHLLHADGRSAARIDGDRGVHQPGTTAADVDLLGFAAARWTNRPIVFGYRTPAAGGRQAVALRCDERFTCTEAFEFPATWTFGEGRELWARGAPDLRSVLVRLYDGAGDVHVWRSTGGVGFTPWAEVGRLLAPVNRASRGRPSVTVSGDPAAPRVTYLRISAPGLTAPGTPPAEQVFRSSDMGSTWRRTGFAFGTGQRGRGGTLPWRGPGPGVDGAAVYGAAGGVVLALGPGGAVFCSRDGGVRWSRSC